MLPSPMRRYRRALRLVVFGAALLATHPSRASAQSIEEAREQWFEAEFESALAGFEAVLARPDLTQARALDAHRYLAVLNQLLGHTAEARSHADAALALDADVEPPEGSPPAAIDLFLMARRRLGGREATVTIEATVPLTLSTPGIVVAHVEPAPPTLFQALRIRCGGAELHGPPPTVELSIVPGELVECTAEAVTSEGAVLRTSHRIFDLVDPVGEPSEGGRKAWPWIVAGSIVAAAAAGTTVGLVLANRPDGANVVDTTVVGW
jgi:hypothetical protein